MKRSQRLNLPFCRRGILCVGHLALAVCGVLANVGWVEEKVDGPRRFALVIASNASRQADQAELRFADDDAARVTELLLDSGVDVELLTTFDTDSQALFPELVPRAVAPTRVALEQRFAALRQRMIDAGGASELMIYYSGHGNVGADGRSFLTLEDAALHRGELFRQIVARSPAARNHILIDACQSETFLLSRGDTWRPDRTEGHKALVEQYLDADSLKQYPNTGAILASSGDHRTHEWELYRGGIFTHQLLSALRGAADVNGDGRIEYSEVGAFVSAANRGVEDRRARLDVTVLPPEGAQRAPLLTYSDLSNDRLLLFVADDRRHYVVEDQRGLRLADLRRASGYSSYLRLPAGELFVRRQETVDGAQRWTESKLAAGQGHRQAEQLSYALPKGRARGALAEAYRSGLFKVAFGRGYYEGYTASQGLLAVEERSWQLKILVDSEGTVSVAPSGEVASQSSTAAVCDCSSECENDEGDDDRDDDDDCSPTWGALSVGLVLTPFRPEGEIRLGTEKLTANRFSGGGPESRAQALRGIDLRWWVFSARGRSDYPEFAGYFRTGFERGHAMFLPKDPQLGFAADEPTQLEYVSVPLFFGANFYPMRRFPVRPLVGLGFGFDILSLKYERAGRRPLSDVSARIGFELHAGLDVRITNFVGLTAEIRQLWSARRRLSDVPSFSARGLTLVSSLRVAFPINRDAAARLGRGER